MICDNTKSDLLNLEIFKLKIIKKYPDLII